MELSSFHLFSNRISHIFLLEFNLENFERCSRCQIWKPFLISVEGMRPAYNQAIQVLATTGVEAPSAKTTLVFHGIPAEALELQVTWKETEEGFQFESSSSLG